MPIETPRSTLKFTAQTRSFGLKLIDNPDAKSTTTLQTPKKIQPSKVYSVLPKHNTPVRKPIKNPFNERLVEFFSGPTCSPDLCSTTVSPPRETDKNEFVWTVEDLWRIDPAPIDSPQTDIEDNVDEETESLVQEAIERYFQESHNILSPIGCSTSMVCSNRSLTPDLPTPKCLSDRAMSTPCTRSDSRRTLKMSVSVQTSLSFNSDIPEELMDLLKPHLNVLDESKNDSYNISSSTLRRKLLFNELVDSPDNSDYEYDHSDKKVLSRFLPSDWTPDKVQSTTELMSRSPDISPIADGIICKDDSFNFTREMAIDFTTSPIKVNSNEKHMSIDFDGGSLLSDSSPIQRSAQTSVDTGYTTIGSFKSNTSQPASEKTSRTTKISQSYFGACGKSSETGLTSTPTSNELS